MFGDEYFVCFTCGVVTHVNDESKYAENLCKTCGGEDDDCRFED